MSRSFNGTTQYLSNAGAVLAAVPLTMACWFLTSDDTNSFTAMSLGVSGSGNNYHLLQIAGSVAGNPVRAGSRTTTTANAASSTGYTANVWQHACGVWASTTDRRAYVNGGSEGLDATSKLPVGVNSTYIGALQSASPFSFFPGLIAEPAIWNVALNASEVAALARGVSPLRIRPGNLKAYWPLYGVGSPEPDYIGGFHLTPNNAPTQADHAPVMPSFAYAQGWAGAFTAEVAGGQPMQLRGTTVPRLRQWQPRGLRG